MGPPMYAELESPVKDAAMGNSTSCDSKKIYRAEFPHSSSSAKFDIQVQRRDGIKPADETSWGIAGLSVIPVSSKSEVVEYHNWSEITQDKRNDMQSIEIEPATSSLDFGYNITTCTRTP